MGGLGRKVFFDDNLARHHQPVIYDPFGFGRNPDPELYYRIMEENGLECLQFYFYWPEQKCTFKYRLTGRLTLFIITACIFSLTTKAIMNGVEWYYHFSIPYPNAILFFPSIFLSVMLASFRPMWLVESIGRVFGLCIGKFFTHKFDFEPIFIYLKNNKPKRIVIAGKGDVEAKPHLNEIYEGDSSKLSLNEGDSLYLKQNDQAQRGETPFKEYPLDEVSMKEGRAQIAVISCFHVFTAKKTLYDKNLFQNLLPLEAHSLTEKVLKDWGETGAFGHDVDDPFSFPYIRFYPPTKLKLKRRIYLLRLLSGLSRILDGLKILIMGR